MRSYFDIDGDGGSEFALQTKVKKEQIRENMAGIGRVIAIGSGKGGVGKSTITAQLAATLNAQGKSVAVLDADLNGPCQVRLSGLKPTIFLPGENGIPIPRTPDGVGVISMGSLFPESQMVDFEQSITKGDSFTWRATREFTVLGDLLKAVDWGELDVLLVDLAPGAERTLQYAEFLGPRAAFALVTIPSDLARGVVSRSVAALRKTDNPILGYIENMCGYCCPDCGEIKPLFPSSSQVPLDIPRLGGVPFDPVLAAMCDRGESIDPDALSPAARAIRDVCEKLIGADV